SELKETEIFIFVTSNTGDGDPPDNSLKFWEFLRGSKSKECFLNTKFTVLGLGDSSYSNFNYTGKRLERTLKELGSTVFNEKGLADDSEGLEEVVDPWIEKLWETLPTVLNQTSDLTIEESIQAEKQLEKEMTELTINAAIENPYSMQNRTETLPGAVGNYIKLKNTLIQVPSVSFKEFPLVIDLAGLAPGTKLTGLPRVSVPIAKLVKLENSEKRELDPKKVPEFVKTPVPITYAPVTTVSCLSTADALKRTLELELDVDESIHFEPGDAFGVVAPNDEGLVQAVLRRLFVSTEAQNDLYKIEGENLPSHLQQANSITLLELFRYGVDLTGQPRKALFRMLADHTTDPNQKLSLMYLCSKQGASVFNAVRNECPNLLDILETFPTCRPPIERLLDLLPAHMPRFYSISSSPLKRNNKIRFAFNVVEYTTEGKADRKGVATPWMDQLTESVPSRSGTEKTEIAVDPEKSTQIPIFVRHNENAFTLPTETERPLILIGPGTGIAPFIGFLEHRQTQRKIRKSMGGIGHQRNIQDAFGPIHVYYGFRNKSKDFLFEGEIREFEADGTITKLRIAESRASDGSDRVYVQDLINQDSQELYDLIIKKDAVIYVCGDAKGMAKGVSDALSEMLVKHQGLDVVEANRTLFSWIADKKYLRDLWA
ncbi:hypothetical protein BY458DRAFT_559970, partial [Sporodiniella umbellata]